MMQNIDCTQAFFADGLQSTERRTPVLIFSILIINGAPLCEILCAMSYRDEKYKSLQDEQKMQLCAATKAEWVANLLSQLSLDSWS